MVSTLRRALTRTGFALLTGLVVACRTTAPPARISHVPDPLLGAVPGVALSSEQQTAVRRALAIAERGEFARAEHELATLPATHPAVRLAAVEITFLQGGTASPAAEKLTSEYAQYPAAWGVLALAYQGEGETRKAVSAARRAAELGLSGNWAERAAEWERVLTDRLLANGTALLQSGDAAGALRVASEVLAATPTVAAARMLATRAHLAMGEAKAAAALVPALPDSDEGLELKGQVAERLGQWDLAVELYSRLASSNPRKCELLRTAREQWRLVNAPPYLTRALTAPVLSRKGLAAILVWKVPNLGAAATGTVPVFEDIVHLQERRDIITAVRANVMLWDAVTRRFGAEHAVTARELQTVLARLASVIGRRPLVWCDGNDVDDCANLPATVTGAAAAALVEQLITGEDSPCRPR